MTVVKLKRRSKDDAILKMTLKLAKAQKRIKELEKENRRLNKENKKLDEKVDLILALIKATEDGG